MFLLDDLFIGLPLKGLMSVADKINEMVQNEIFDERKIKEELMQLQILYDIEQITEEEYQKKEELLLARLTLIRENM